MFEGAKENLRHISASNSITEGKRKRLLSHVDAVLPSRSVQKDAGSDDGVLQATRANLSLDAATPDEGVAFPEIQASGKD
jgi:hypothetical protein